MQQGVQAVNNLTIKLSTFFPQATTVSTSVTTGTISFTSSTAAGWLQIVTSSGGQFKVPLYLP
jgi:hypothetical protein